MQISRSCSPPPNPISEVRAKNVETKLYPITPVPAPRQVESDRWNKRPCVLRYRAFKDQVKAHGVELPVPCKVTFYLPMPKSWSKREKALQNGAPHTQEPDVDNLLKALMDAVFQQREGKNDSHVWSIAAEKRWSETGHFTVERILGEHGMGA